jgi:PPOX class probable F420-dependent enzyme
MSGRRAEIRMTDEETAAFLEEQRVLICATQGRDGWPHLMPLWFLPRAGELFAWTYARSQKVRNLERDPRATLQVETGHSYTELRGVMVKAQAEVLRNHEVVAQLGLALAGRYGDASAHDGEALVRRQAAKRVALRFIPREIATWDHRKLGDTP